MSVTRDVLSQLPEFPQQTFEAIGTLERSDRGPFVTLIPNTPQLPTKPTLATPRAPKTSTTKVKYYSQAVYPKVFCYDPGVLGDGMTLRALDGTAPAGMDHLPDAEPSVLGGERFYKLSKLKSGPLRNPLVCSVRSGPWTCEVWETTSCIDGEPNRWDFWIIDIPEVALSWWGRWEDMPAYPSLIVSTYDLRRDPNSRPVFACCDGYVFCPGVGCIPQGVPCNTAPSPA
jgi:hypothetical protein